jgi:hypothetical protein
MHNKLTTVFSASLFVMTVLLMTLGSVGTETIGAQDRPAPAQASAATMKGILAKVPASVSTGFLESMFFVDGRLASVRIGGVKGALNKSDYLALLRSIGLSEDHQNACCVRAGQCKWCIDGICNPQYCTDGPCILLKDMLRKAPPAQRTQFLNSLDFKDGHLISINAKVIEKHALKEELGVLPKK